MPADPFGLVRFTDAQAHVYPRVVEELTRGRKESHWMWFIFPQIAGLGRSPVAQTYAIRSLAEARAYLADPVLGARLRACTDLVNRIAGKTARDIFGTPDDLKFRSSMTLFANATEDNTIFLAALERYYSGEPDPATLALIGLT